MRSGSLLLIACAVSFIMACNNSKTGVEAAAENKTKKAPANYLTMKINGTPWIADQDIFGAFHPDGYDKAILITGNKGPKDEHQQAFNLHLFKTEGPGEFNIQHGNAAKNVVQMGNLSPQNYLYGSMLGFSMKVKVLTASGLPDEIEAEFEGEMMGNAGDKLIITEGKFYYHE